MLIRMRRAGFREATWTPYTFGIAGLYRGKKFSFSFNWEFDLDQASGVFGLFLLTLR